MTITVTDTDMDIEWTPLERWGLEEGVVTVEELLELRRQEREDSTSLSTLKELPEGPASSAETDAWTDAETDAWTDVGADAEDKPAVPAADEDEYNEEELRAYVRDFPRKFEPSDLTPALRRLATDYTANYKGDFEWMLQQQEKLERFGSLFDGSLKGALNTLRAELRRQQAASGPQEGVDLSGVPDGYYAVRNARGEVTFYGVQRSQRGWTFVHQIIGGGRKERVAALRPGEYYSGSRQQHLAEIAKDPKEASCLFGRELGYCGVCGLPLTDAASRARGIGPICSGKRGW